MQIQRTFSLNKSYQRKESFFLFSIFEYLRQLRKVHKILMFVWIEIYTEMGIEPSHKKKIKKFESL